VLRQVRFDLSFDDPKLADHQQVMVSGDRLQLDALSEAVRTYVQQLLEPDAQQMQPALQHLHPADGGHPIAPLPQHLLQPETPRYATAASSSRPEPNTVLAMPTAIYLKPAGLLAHDLHLGPLATAASGEVLRLSATQLFDLANALDDYAAEAVALPAMGRSRWSSPTTGWLRTAAVLVLALGATGGITKFVMDVTQTPSPTVATRDASTTADAAPEAFAGSPATDQLFEEEGPNGSLLVPDQANPNAVPPVPPGGVAQGPQPGIFRQPGAVPQPQPQPQGAPAPLAQAPQFPTGATTAPPAGASIAAAPTQTGRAPMQASPLEQPQNPGVLVPSQGAQMPESGLLRSDEAGPSGTVLPSGDSTSSAALNPAGIPTRRSTGISQLDEANQYFQERWTPPESLNQAIEYRVLVNADGTVQQVLPLGIVAGNYIDRTGMPLMGESFVSPTTNGQPALIRVVLAPNGRVQTFLEEMN
jgi:hypothetical protein